MKHVALAAALFFTATNQPSAAETKWLSEAAFERHVSTNGKVIPTGIACRVRNGKLEIQLAYRPLSSMKKPFHKWNYVIARPDQVASAVAKLKRSDRPDLKYRVVMQDTVSSGGLARVCAVAFR